jgi:hypothetical protein
MTKRKFTDRRLTPAQRQAERLFRLHGTLFVHRFLQAHPDRALALPSREPTVCWEGGGLVNYAAVGEFSGPTTMGEDAPLLPEVRVNDRPPPAVHHHLATRKVQQTLGVPPSAPLAETPTLRLVALPDELDVFGTWLADWFSAQSHPDAPVPTPPITLLVWGSKEGRNAPPETFLSVGAAWRHLGFLWTPRALQLFATFWSGEP